MHSYLSFRVKITIVGYEIHSWQKRGVNQPLSILVYRKIN